MRTARLFALYRLGADWHGGQWTRVYRIHCRASTALLKLGIRHPWDSPTGHGPKNWPPEFRRNVAKYLRRYRRDFRAG